MARHLLLVGSSSAALRAAAELGFRVTHLDDIRRVRPEHLGRAARMVLTDLSDEAEVLAMAAAVHRADPVELVLSMQEDSLEVAARLAARLGVPGLAADAVANTRDKARMRAVTQAAGLASTVPFLAGPSTPGDRLRWAGEVGYPVISKPRDGSGSRDIRIHRRAEDLAAAAPAALLEKYVGGSEHSIEAVSCDGVHHLVAVTDKTVSADGRFVEMGHCQPSRLPADVLGRARDELAAFLDAVGVVNGVTHTEIKVCDGRVFIVESHTRPGGDRIVEITKAATGVDLAVAGLAAVAGLPPAGVAATRPGGAVVSRYFTLAQAEIAAVHGLDTVRADPAVLMCHFPYGTGDTPPRTVSSSTRHGYLICRGADLDEATAAVARLAALVKVEYRR